MRTHRLAGVAMAALGLTLLVLQLLLLYGSAAEPAWVVAIGLPGAAVMSALGAVSFSAGCLLATAPRATVRHVRRVTGLVRPPRESRHAP